MLQRLHRVLVSNSHSPSCLTLTITLRHYATHNDRDPPAPFHSNNNPYPPGLSNSLDTPATHKKRLADAYASASASPQYVGPFPMGITPPSHMASGDAAKVKKWKELGVGGKVVRTTQQTSNFAIILLGAGLTAVLAYAIGTELFSSNSPTVLYGEACERIKASPKIARYLSAPLTFHNNPPSSTRPRHRNHTVSSQVAVDVQGREHLLLSFYVRGSSHSSTKLSNESEDQSYFSKISNVTWKDVESSTSKTFERFKSFFRYLTGQPSTSIVSHPSNSNDQQHEQLEKPKDSWWTSSLSGVFNGIRDAVSSRRDISADGVAEGRKEDYWREGEVHADLVKDEKGYFVWRYILVDLINSRTGHPTRVFVERTPDVREGEAVMRWN